MSATQGLLAVDSLIVEPSSDVDDWELMRYLGEHNKRSEVPDRVRFRDRRVPLDGGRAYCPGPDSHHGAVSQSFHRRGESLPDSIGTPFVDSCASSWQPEAASPSSRMRVLVSPDG